MRIALHSVILAEGAVDGCHHARVRTSCPRALRSRARIHDWIIWRFGRPVSTSSTAMTSTGDHDCRPATPPMSAGRPTSDALVEGVRGRTAKSGSRRSARLCSLTRQRSNRGRRMTALDTHVHARPTRNRLDYPGLEGAVGSSRLSCLLTIRPTRPGAGLPAAQSLAVGSPAHRPDWPSSPASSCPPTCVARPRGAPGRARPHRACCRRAPPPRASRSHASRSRSGARLEVLARRGLTFDACIHIVGLLEGVPDLRVVLDHVGKPPAKGRRK